MDIACIPKERKTPVFHPSDIWVAVVKYRKIIVKSCKKYEKISRADLFTKPFHGWQTSSSFKGRVESMMNCSALASYQIRKIAGCACASNAGNVFHATDFNGIVSFPGMHRNMCVMPVMHVGIANTWWGKNVPSTPEPCATRLTETETAVAWLMLVYRKRLVGVNKFFKMCL